MTKQEKLDKLDDMLADAFIDIMEKEAYEVLPDLSSLSNYLAKNNRVEEKKKSTIEEEIRERVKKAEARRRKNDK